MLSKENKIIVVQFTTKHEWLLTNISLLVGMNRKKKRDRGHAFSIQDKTSYSHHSSLQLSNMQLGSSNSWQVNRSNFKPVTYRNIHACVCVIERENSASVKDWILVLTEICFMNLKSIGGVWFVFSNNNFQFLNNITRIFTHFFTYTYFHTCF